MSKENHEKEDIASGSYDVQFTSGYDSPTASQSHDEKLDATVLRKRNDSRAMALAAIYIAATFAIIFLMLAIINASAFAEQYQAFLSDYTSVSSKNELSPWAFAPLLAPVVMFSLMGIISLITIFRFITAYTDAAYRHESSDSTKLQDIVRDIAQAFGRNSGG